MVFNSIFSFKDVLGQLKNTLVPFAQQNVEDADGVPDKAKEMGFNGQIGNIEDPTENRGVSGIQLKRSFYNIFFRKLTAALPVLTDTMSELFQFFIRDYCLNDRKYAKDLDTYYISGDVSYTETSGRFQHNQLVSNSWQPITLLHDRGKTVLGYPSVWPSTSIPSWAIDIGTHKTYTWANYPNINGNSALKTVLQRFLTATSNFGASFTTTTFTCPDLRGISPAVWASGAGGFLASNAGQHTHVWGSTSLTIASASSKHSHTGVWTHSPHNHVCPTRPFSTGGSGAQSWCGKNKYQSHEAKTSSAGAHSHGVTVGSASEKHTHTTGNYTPGVNTAIRSGASGTVTRVRTYPVKLIVRVE